LLGIDLRERRPGGSDTRFSLKAIRARRGALGHALADQPADLTDPCELLFRYVMQRGISLQLDDRIARVADQPVDREQQVRPAHPGAGLGEIHRAADLAEIIEHLGGGKLRPWAPARAEEIVIAGGDPGADSREIPRTRYIDIGIARIKRRGGSHDIRVPGDGLPNRGIKRQPRSILRTNGVRQQSRDGDQHGSPDRPAELAAPYRISQAQPPFGLVSGLMIYANYVYEIMDVSRKSNPISE
jgi:hypothetical protein